MNGLRNKYCLSFFKTILFIVGLTFLATQSSFKFYRFASLPFGVSSSKAISRGTVSPVATAILSQHKQGRAKLLLDKRYDFKHIFISSSPFCRLAILPAQSNRYFFDFPVFFAAGDGQQESMRGPPHFS
jgi:hypothetical protein